MGRRKSKKAKPKRVVKRPLETVFNCPFCNHHESVTVKLKRIDAIATLMCVVCKREFRSQITNLSAAIDVYYEWLDFCEKETNKSDGEDQFTDGVRISGTGLMASGLGDDDDDRDGINNNENTNDFTDSLSENEKENEKEKEKEKEKKKEKKKKKENDFLIESDSFNEKSSKSDDDSDESSDYRSSRRKKKRRKSKKHSERKHRSHRSSKKKRKKKRSKKEKRRSKKN
ncbi:transcription elongation factor 1 [Anaeramoeba flamelloides]|uniref:Transcription elongation factor 1 homolog n=1 Tax=Anaeramoeba flamelloides TaxID=1746091 RepID=A0AAV7ZQT0_9EUKA|nr:transcription elongation factor 1 [Anaeramoeba flamelloides]